MARWDALCRLGKKCQGAHHDWDVIDDDLDAVAARHGESDRFHRHDDIHHILGGFGGDAAIHTEDCLVVFDVLADKGAGEVIDTACHRDKDVEGRQGVGEGVGIDLGENADHAFLARAYVFDDVVAKNKG